MGHDLGGPGGTGKVWITGGGTTARDGVVGCYTCCTRRCREAERDGRADTFARHALLEERGDLMREPDAAQTRRTGMMEGEKEIARPCWVRGRAIGS